MTTVITYDHTRARTTEHIYDVEVNGVIVAAASNWSMAELVALEVEAREELLAMAAAFAQAGREQSITVEGMELHAPAECPACPCGRPAVFFLQYPHKVYAYCVECYEEQTTQRGPLLAQCAAVIRRCLGSTTGTGGIIEELRRVETALRMEGW
jgi:hypothetical protein